MSDADDVSVKSISCIEVLPIRKRLLVGGIGGVNVYDGLSEAARNPMLADLEPTVAILYNEHFGTFVSAAGRTVKVWDANTGELQEVYRKVTDDLITAICLDDSQKKIVVGDAGGSLRVLNALNGALMKESDVPHAGCVSSVWYSAELHAVLSSSWDKSLRLYDDTETDADSVFLSREARQHDDEVSCSTVSESLCLMASGAVDGSVALWDYDANTSEAALRGHSAEITAVLFLDPLPLLVSADTDGNMCVWLVRPIVRGDTAGRCVLRVQNKVPGSTKTKPLLALAYVHELGIIYSGDASGTMQAWSIKTALWRLGIAEYVKPEPVGEEPDGKEKQPWKLRMVSYEKYRQINRVMMQRVSRFSTSQEALLKPGDVKILKSWQAHTDSIRCVHLIRSKLSNCGSSGLISCSYDRTIRLWDLRARPIGVLHQGGAGAQPWAFSIDLAKRRHIARNKALGILEHNRRRGSDVLLPRLQS